MESQDWEAHTIPPHLTEELFPGLSYEEALEDQQALYEAFTLMGGMGNPSSDISSFSTTGQEGDHYLRQPSRSSWEDYYQVIDVNSQLALDEEMARLMQNLEDNDDEDDNISFPEHDHSSTTDDGNEEEEAPANAAAAAADANASEASATSSTVGNEEDGQDDVDPDEMTYEELQDLGETIGSEHKGLSEDEISSLPYYNYKPGGYSSNLRECAICYSCYEDMQYVTTLPCAHPYHSECINKWLRLSKSCPICQVEVDVSSSLDR